MADPGNADSAPVTGGAVETHATTPEEDAAMAEALAVAMAMEDAEAAERAAAAATDGDGYSDYGGGSAPVDDHLLPQTMYDVIVVGTGLVEAMVAGACAKAGHSVLHLDANVHYGGLWATLNLESFSSHIDEAAAGLHASTRTVKVGSEAATSAHASAPLTNIVRSDVKEGLSVSGAEGLANLLPSSRDFNIDLTPRLVGSSSRFVQVLINSGVGRYLEFKSLEGAYILFEDTLRRVPASKEDIFASELHPREKRRLMKFLKACTDGEVEAEDGASFEALLTAHAITEPELRQYLLYAIAMGQHPQEDEAAADHRISAADGIQAVRAYAASLGRYGSTAFLAPMYGGCEMSQAFCRLCAINGGLYVLRRGIQAITTTPGGDYTGIVCEEGQALASKKLVLAPDYAACYTRAEPSKRLSRAVLVTDASLHPTQGIVEVVVPPGAAGNTNPVVVIQGDASMFVSARGTFLVHLVTLASGATAVDDLRSVVNALFKATPEADNEDGGDDDGDGGDGDGGDGEGDGGDGDGGGDGDDGVAPEPESGTGPVDGAEGGDGKAAEAETGGVETDAAETGTEGGTGAEAAVAEEEEAVNETLVPLSQPRVVWAVYFNQSHRVQRDDGVPDNVFVTDDPSPSVVIEDSVAAAERVFEAMFPGEAFLPADDIEEPEAAAAEGGDGGDGGDDTPAVEGGDVNTEKEGTGDDLPAPAEASEADAASEAVDDTTGIDGEGGDAESADAPVESDA